MAGDDRCRLHPLPDLRAPKQGATGVDRHGERGYHPLVASVAGSGEVLHTRLREGVANSGRGAGSFVAEAIGRARRAGASGPICLRADSGFYSHKVVDACRKAGVTCSITVKLTKAVHKVIAQIPADAWTPIPYWLDGGADVAETSYRPFGRKGRVTRLIVRRVRPTPGSQLALFCDYDYHGLSPTARERPWHWRPTTAATPRWRTPSAT